MRSLLRNYVSCAYLTSISPLFFVTDFSHFVCVQTDRSGGKVFEDYVKLCGSWSSFEALKVVHLQLADEDMPDEPNADICNKILEDESSFFHGYILHVCAKVSTQGRRQLFWSTWNATFHGLSRMGLFLQAQLGFMTKPSTFDTQRKKEHDQSTEKLKYVKWRAVFFVKININYFLCFVLFLLSSHENSS